MGLGLKAVVLLPLLLPVGVGCGGVCADVAPNFNLTEVAYDQGGAVLYVSGNQSLSYCEDTWESVDKYGAIQVILDLNSLEHEAEIKKTEERTTIKAPRDIPRVYSGSFGDYCYKCELRLHTRDNSYSLLFTTDYEAINASIEGHDIFGSSMLLSISKGEDILVEFTFGYLSANRIPN